MKLQILIIVVLSLLMFNCGKDTETGSQDTEWEQQAIPVLVDTAKLSLYENYLSFNGTLQAIQTARIIPEIPGKIAAQYVSIGDFIAAGDTLAQMDISTLELQFEQASAGYRLAKASLGDAKKDWNRVETLRSEQAISQQQYEKASLGLEAGQAQLSQAKAGFDLLQMQLDKSTLTTPIDGVVTQKGFEVGDLFSPAFPMPLYTVQDVSKIKVELQITSQEIHLIKKGQPAMISVDYLDEPQRGFVTLVGVAADPMSKTFFVECQFVNSEGLLRAGTFGNVSIAVEQISGVIVVPRKAIVNGNYLFVLESSHAYKREVMISHTSDLDVIIDSGLDIGEAFISEGGYILADSSLVRVTSGG